LHIKLSKLPFEAKKKEKKKEEETCFSISPFTNPILGISFFSYILGAKSYI
jgi:hypothetical protein